MHCCVEILYQHGISLLKNQGLELKAWNFANGINSLGLLSCPK